MEAGLLEGLAAFGADEVFSQLQVGELPVLAADGLAGLLPEFAVD